MHDSVFCMPRFLLRINHILLVILCFYACIPIPVAKAKTENFLAVDAQAECKLSSKGWVMECDDQLQKSLEENARKLCTEHEKVSQLKIVDKRKCVANGELYLCVLI